MLNRKWILITLIISFNNKTLTESVKNSNFAVSVANMKHLIMLENLFLENLALYCDELEEKMILISSSLNTMIKDNIKARKDPELFLENPLNSFALIRRLFFDWPDWIEYFDQPVGFEILEVMEVLMKEVPTHLDLVDAVDGIYRIQSVYGLKAGDIAKGLLNGQKYDAKLTALDAFFIGEELFKKGYFNYAFSWQEVALCMDFDNEPYKTLFEQSSENLYLIYSNNLIKLNRTIKDLNIIKDECLYYSENVTVNLIDEDKTTIDYKLCCQDHLQNNVANLHCRYNSTTNYFLKLAPIKMEELSLDPYIVMFYDIISSTEISAIKTLASTDLQRAGVVSYYGNETNSSSDRTAGSYWLEGKDGNKVKSILSKTIDLTGFDWHGFESPQVLNYGIGGHFVMHYDFFQHQDIYSPLNGNRIATVIFYLSNVEQGGATAFVKLNITVHPKKGAALLWYNLKNNGEYDYRTLHSGCPVIVGSKWITTVWIRENPQFLIKPCYN